MVSKHTKKEYTFYHDKHRRAIYPVRWTFIRWDGRLRLALYVIKVEVYHTHPRYMNQT